MSSNCLFDEPPLVVSPTLATMIGLNEAIVLQQIHYWLHINQKTNQHYRDGRYWTYNSIPQWRESNFPFWSESTVKRIFTSLEKRGILLSAKLYDGHSYDQRKRYSIDYDKLQDVIDEYQKQRIVDLPSGQNDPMDEVNMTRSNGAERPDLTETPTETPSEDSLNVFNGFSLQKTESFSSDVLQKQIIASCHRNEVNDSDMINEVSYIIRYFYFKYYCRFNREHPRLNNKTMDKCVFQLIGGSDNCIVGTLLGEVNRDDYKLMIDKYFETWFADCDYHLPHFVTSNVRELRYYEAVY